MWMITFWQFDDGIADIPASDVHIIPFAQLIMNSLLMLWYVCMWISQIWLAVSEYGWEGLTMPD